MAALSVHTSAARAAAAAAAAASGLSASRFLSFRGGDWAQWHARLASVIKGPPTAGPART